eukprot:Hpha_TRINITY_DN29055_c0_g1::TRINITY_DN29055_c0_g1_i1::g.156518::m.156518/K18426/ECHDC1; ethylmalonyl-CoA/methylmalonyl-CoA decarboxylase
MPIERPVLSAAASHLRGLTTGGRVRAGVMAVAPRGKAEVKVGVIYLDNPAKKNALCGRMMTQLRGALEAHAASGTQCVVLFGSRGSWCAGAEMPTLGESATGGHFHHYMVDTLNSIPDRPYILIGAVEGHAIGGGAELTTAPDIRVFEERTKLRFVQASLGVVTGWGGAARLKRIVG